jgi:hypothetical protein
MSHEKRAPTEADALCSRKADNGYIFFAEQMLVLASHVPPAFAQSAAVFAVVTLPANAGPVKAKAKATARMETTVFMAFSPCAELERSKSAPSTQEFLDKAQSCSFS